MGVFTDNTQAQQAMDELQSAGFQANQIRYSVRKGGIGITDSLEDLGLPEQEAGFYNGEFEAGRTVVMVNTNDRQQDAYDILRRYGAYDFNSRSAHTVGYSSTGDTNAQRYATDIEGQQRVQLREEELRAHKQAVQTGEI